MKPKKSGGENLLQSIVNPIIPQFSLKDTLQVIIGASILAVPVGFTEETWRLGETLPFINVLGLLALSVFFVTMFTYYHYHKHTQQNHHSVFVKRVVSTYVFSFLVVALIMTLIQRAPWSTDLILAVKRVVIVTFPSTMSAAIADTFK